MLKPFLKTFSLKSLKPFETTMPGMLFLWWISTQCVFVCPSEIQDAVTA